MNINKSIEEEKNNEEINDNDNINNSICLQSTKNNPEDKKKVNNSINNSINNFNKNDNSSFSNKSVLNKRDCFFNSESKLIQNNNMILKKEFVRLHHFCLQSRFYL